MFRLLWCVKLDLLFFYSFQITYTYLYAIFHRITITSLFSFTKHKKNILFIYVCAKTIVYPKNKRNLFFLLANMI